MTEDERRGFHIAVDRIMELLSQQANDCAKLAKELKEKHGKSKPLKYKALALMDFKLYLDQTFNMMRSL